MIEFRIEPMGENPLGQVKFVAVVDLQQAKLAVANEDVRRQLALRVGQIVAEQVETYFGSTLVGEELAKLG
jgi:hypothetical protein